MSKLLRIASAAVLIGATTLLTPVLPAKEKDKTAATQTAETAGKDAKSKEAKHKKAAKNADQNSSGETAAAKPVTPKK